MRPDSVATIHARSDCRTSLVTVALCALLSTTFLSPAESMAQTPSTVARFNFDLPVQRLADSLRAVASQAGTTIAFDPATVGERNAPSIHGSFSVQEALERLLERSGLSVRRTAGGSYLVSESAPSIPPRAAATVTSESAGSEREFDLTEIVVTAQKRSERLQDVPIPVSVLDTQSLTENNQTLLQDYYASIPGLSLAPTSAAGVNLSIRGITTGGAFTNPTVGVMVDEVPFGGSTGLWVPDIDPGDLERIEVLRGPQGTLYGADSMGGLLKYVTKDPSTAGYSGRIEAGTSTVYNGNEMGFNIRGSANVPVTDSFAIRVSGFERQDPGYIDNPVINTLGVNLTKAEGARLAALWQPSEDLSLKVSALYQRTRANGLSEVDVQPGLKDLQQDYVAGLGGYDKTYQAYSALLSYHLGNIDIVSVTGYNVDHAHYGADDTAGLAPFVSGGLPQYGIPANAGYPIYDDNNNKKATQELRFSSDVGRLKWLVGAFYTYEDDPSSEDSFVTDPSTGQLFAQFYHSTAHSTFQEYAGFLDLTLQITEPFDIQLGGRESRIQQHFSVSEVTGPYADYFAGGPIISPSSDSDASVFTYLVTPRLRLSPDLMLYARFASGYRPGGSNGFVTGVPAQFEPDTTVNYELGAKGDFLEHRLLVEASLYYVNWRDIQIQLVNASLNPYEANGSGAKSEGVELSASVKPAKGLRVDAWVSYDDAVLTRSFGANSTAYGEPGDRLPNTSRFSGNVSAEQEFPVGRAVGYIGAQASYVGDRISVFQGTDPVSGAPLPRQQFPSYTKTDLRAGVRMDGWTVNAYVNNVADVRGVLQGGFGYFDPQAFLYITPRIVGIDVSKTF